jgi:uncharacterized protein (DUF983 family)
MPVAYSAHPTGQDAERSLGLAMRRGFALRCPRCGIGHIFRAYLKVRPTCDNCGLELHRQRADDAPPYFTILIVGHIIVPGMLILQEQADPPAWVQYALWLPLALLLTLVLLPRVKGALIGFQWARAMHGFGGLLDEPETISGETAGHGAPPGAP